MTHQNFNKCSRENFIEGCMGGEENEEADREGDEKEDVGDEEVGEGLWNVLEHLDIFAEPRNFTDEEHLESKKSFEQYSNKSADYKNKNMIYFIYLIIIR